ncbi:response regulator [Solicola gregarius]|uniref:Response regulator transcription factor n=1 Tax=Solicola gregarius TaxID=2908642 RepID=A0AA46THH7_9ACTN|nr:response regulator transcription factor [Solicola gregarius]UYM05452.1 response regulator transcription factor [Solicola gregarius]
MTDDGGPIRVLLVDDQDLIRAGFRMILSVEDDIEVIGEVADGREAIEATIRDEPDVVLMDVQMPGMDGIEATREIVARTCEPKVVILTTFDSDEYLFESLQAGASGFLLKNSDPDDLVSAIRSIADGYALLAPEVTQRVITRFARTPGQVVRDADRMAELTERERDVLVLMARGLSNAEIAAELVLGEATVKTHVSRILMKLDVRDRVKAVVAAYESGLVAPQGG